MMEDALFYAQSRGGSHPVALEFTATGNVYADKDRIGQVLRNLIKNATKYTPPGSAITLRAEDAGDKVRIAVIDAGPGIDEVEAASIFEKYKRGRQSEERRVAGAGIGLYVSRQILQAHGQDLHLDSRIGEGSTFWFDLSRTAEAIPANRTLGA
ncbi:MAG: sensor histidine kinase, partial [Chloroflexota bacterium]